MTDLLAVLPDFLPGPFSHVLPALERASIRTADLLTLDAVDVAKQAQLPAREVRRLADAILAQLHAHLQIRASPDPPRDTPARASGASSLKSDALHLESTWKQISCLDDNLDSALGGGVPTGYLTEVTGESGAGKTHLLLTLLLAVQLPPPRGLGRNAIYISTEAPLATSRLTQLLDVHPILSSAAAVGPSHKKPSLAGILSISTPDLEAQDHILRYQLPIAIRRHNVGLVVLDSVTANFRAEFEAARDERGSGSGSGNGTANNNSSGAMARRSAQLTELGALLRQLATAEDIAVVVANQVADRFSAAAMPLDALPSSSSVSAPPNSQYEVDVHEPMTLDHQQRWFTGWGDDAAHRFGSAGLKTPSLGLVWTNQLACRIALTRRMVRGTGTDGGNMRWKRHMRVVFAPWAPDSAGAPGTEFEITKEGIVGVKGSR